MSEIKKKGQQLVIQHEDGTEQPLVKFSVSAPKVEDEKLVISFRIEKELNVNIQANDITLHFDAEDISRILKKAGYK